MKDQNDREEQDMDELEELQELRRRIAKMEALEAERQQREEQISVSQVNRRKSLALVLTSIPALMGLCLITLNAEYMGTMILPCENRAVSAADCAQPFGWALLGLAFVLSSLSLLIVLRTRVLLNEYWWIGLALLLLFFILPALAILVLGPAALILLEAGLS